MSELKLFRFKQDLYYGDIDCLFIATQEQVNSILNLEIYLGEIRGKHSEIFVTLDEEDFSSLELDQGILNKLADFANPNSRFKHYVSGIDILGTALDYLEDLKAQEEANDKSNLRNMK